jgi:MFS transporter, ACS family, hexuronate transporter
VLKARMLLVGCAVTVLAFQFMLGYVSSMAGIISILCVMMLCATTWLVNVGTIPVDVFPKRVVGRVVGLCTSCSILGSLVFVPFVGRMLKAGNYRLLFAIMSILPLAAFVVLRALTGKTEQVPPNKHNRAIQETLS